MIDLLEINGNDIASLKDHDLRILIGLLCEADYKKYSLPTHGIYWGGDQDAPDGGFDVYINHKIAPPNDSFIPAKKTGIQVKKPNMPPSAIKKEMLKKGVLKSEIKSLIESGGSYIIISSNSSTSKSALDNRLSAMEECLMTECINNSGKVLFFDQGQIATWVRNHKSLVIWTRNKIGRPILGWQSFSNWSYPKGNVLNKFIIDEELKLYSGSKSTDNGESVLNGIIKLQQSLSVHRNSVRLVGLSGVGKTRLVQALFDERILTNALDKYLAIYTDVSDSPLPDPKALCETIVRDNIRAIIIVDNCGPELHRKLTRIITSSGCASLITIEYDVKSDLPEETSVFRLEPAGDNAIIEFIKSRYKFINSIDALSIAKFSGGNFRLAIALSNTLKVGENISELGDQELFERLFIQRNSNNDELLLSAMACSLVYSFEGTDVLNENSEMNILSSLADKSVSKLYRDIDTLSKRDLIQSRGPWRALLPHALSNKLANNALGAIPPTQILESFQNSNERLIMSFAHRLSFLYNNLVAQEIANHFLKTNGKYGALNGKLNYNQLKTIEYLAAVSPSGALELLEFWSSGPASDFFLSRNNRYHYHYTRILKNIAYDPTLFTRSLKIIIGFALNESPKERVNSTRDILAPFFQIRLSGSLAKIGQRLLLVKELLESPAIERQNLGIFLSNRLLKSSYLTGSPYHRFGARKRTFGYQPQNSKEFYDWYIEVIHFLSPFLTLNSRVGNELRRYLGDNLRTLICTLGLISELELLIIELHQKFMWNEGWLGLKSILKYDSKKIENKQLEEIKLFEKRLRPSSLEEKIRLYVLNEKYRVFEIEGNSSPDEPNSEMMQRIADYTTELGELLSNNLTMFRELLPELMKTKNGRVKHLGIGLFSNVVSRKIIWSEIETLYALKSNEKNSPDLIIGFLESCNQIVPKLHDNLMKTILDEKSPLLEWFPILQGTKKLDKSAIKRIHKSLDLGLTDIHNYQSIGYHYFRGEIEDVDLLSLLREIMIKDEGEKVALDILATIAYDKNKLPQELAEMAYSLICMFDFNTNYYPDVYCTLNKVAEIIFESKIVSINADRKFCTIIANHLNQDRLSSDIYNDLIITLAQKQPDIFLDVFLNENSPPTSYSVYTLFREEMGISKNPIDSIPTHVFVEWAEINPSKRYTVLSDSINLVENDKSTTSLKWKQIVFEILANTETTPQILLNLEYFIYPRSWSGSRSVGIKSRLVLLDSLVDHPKKVVRNWVKSCITRAKEDMEYWDNIDAIRNRKEMETFE